MKTITIKQPWASLEIEGIKNIENRTWPTKYRGRVLVHAAKSWNKQNADICINNEQVNKALNNLGIIHKYDDEEIGYNGYSFSMPTGAIIGSVEIGDCVVNHPSIWAEQSNLFLGSNIWNKPTYNWVLANPIKFPEPIPAKGKLSFWDYPNILAEPEEKNGELFCHCQLPVSEKAQVMSLVDHFRCRYCGGKWYK